MERTAAQKRFEAWDNACARADKAEAETSAAWAAYRISRTRADYDNWRTKRATADKLMREIPTGNA